jgi:serine/threonine protein kinase
METLFPDANPLALDLLGKMMEFDQERRIGVDGALSHPYLMELHSKAKVCSPPHQSFVCQHALLTTHNS